MLTRRRLLIGLGVASLISVTGCGRRDESDLSCSPSPIDSGHDCAVCGMFVSHHPGPKGQVCLRHNRGQLNFCSTRDLFAWLLQPEASAQVAAVYVHDMAKTDWASPSDSAFIDAKSAYFVVGHGRTGAMGATLAPFGQLADAEAFVAEHGGRVLSYSDIDLDTLQNL
ncbi:hypothetical protein CAI21_18550 [Alkalilimnicola ehrlichii]|uniref:NosL family protein n=1 Tax=Alkalilimnicola ehrlichii TaxID=351052 RepID=A0A3E0WLJ0_9GAMM|nr:nitrous oxide reductase accessory protein NosL [Alkalilimnicola ehrlichii]RFA25765.1 hypothetical protein CAI21_18550 [Alkalilimnicola ehrlichii]RFA32846.1 hypothetical protein CAL65_18805 [Alkalilimnicola ehrlichii]